MFVLVRSWNENYSGHRPFGEYEYIFWHNYKGTDFTTKYGSLGITIGNEVLRNIKEENEFKAHRLLFNLIKIFLATEREQ